MDGGIFRLQEHRFFHVDQGGFILFEAVEHPAQAVGYKAVVRGQAHRLFQQLAGLLKIDVLLRPGIAEIVQGVSVGGVALDIDQEIRLSLRPHVQFVVGHGAVEQQLAVVGVKIQPTRGYVYSLRIVFRLEVYQR